jgi:hypothetical protein
LSIGFLLNYQIQRNEDVKDNSSSGNATPEKKHGKNMRRLMKLVSQAFLNPGERAANPMPNQIEIFVS